MEGVVDSLANQPVQVNGAAKELHMALLEKRFIPGNYKIEVNLYDNGSVAYRLGGGLVM